jgi:hypothetical protein
MNYIPGFSKYLETSVPRYAIGGRVMDGERMMYDMGGYGDNYDMGGYSEPYQYTPPVEQYMPVEQPMMYGGYDTGGYSEMPYGGGGMLPAPVEQPYQQAAVEPMTTEAVPAEVPFDPNTFDFSKLDLSGLDNLYGMNFGSNFGGGPMGGIYQADPNLQYIGAPLSNKGNATSQTGGNTFAVRADQPVRLVDHRTNQIVFEGSGFDAARKATELGQGLTDQFGRKANYSIQTADPTGNFSTVAYEKKNKSTLGQIANVAGTVLPLATLAIPGLGPALFGMTSGAFAASLPAQLAFGALTGAASSGLKGQNVLKGAALGGLTAAGGAMLPKIPAIGDLGKLAKPLGVGVGATVGGLATGQSLKNSLLGGAASGALAYAAPGIQKSLGIGQGPNVSAGGADTSVSTGANAASGPAPIATVIGNTGFSAPVSIGGGSPPQTKLAELEPPATIVSGSASPFAAAVPIPTNFLSGALPLAQQPVPDQMSEEDTIKVTGALPGATPNINLGSGLPPQVIDQIAQPAETLSPEEILVEARKSFNPVSVTSPISTDFLPESVLSKPTVDVNDTVSPEEILVEARKPFTPNVPVGGALSPEVLRAIEGPPEDDIIKVTGRQTTTTPALIPGFETPMPDMAETAEEAEAKKKKLGVEEYLRIAGILSGLVGGGGGGGSGQTGTYGGGGTGRLNPIFSAKLPSAGGLGTIGATRTARPMGDQDWLTYGTRPELNFFDYAQPATPAPALPTPITSPIPNNPAGPSMYAPEVDNMRFAQGGSLAAKRGGSPRRTEFAVNGPGTGRSDDIPAVLSDGEYVIDAETVALLGDGSNKAGAKKLDELRVKVRKHKGQKLAKGRFSANAKKPDAYLSGGRI